MGLMDRIRGGSPASSPSEGGEDEDVEQMIEKWTGRPQRGQMVRRMPVSPVHSHTFLHSTVLQHIPNTECHVDVTVCPTTVPLCVHHVPVCPSMDPTCLTLHQSSPHQLGTAPLIINSSDCHKFDEHQLHLKVQTRPFDIVFFFSCPEQLNR